MPPPAADAPQSGPPPRARSPRRDPVLLLIVAAVLLALRVALILREAPAQGTPGAGTLSGPEVVRWRTLEAGLAEARASGRPVLYDFTADWCPPCRLMQREVFADPRAAALLERRFVPVRVLDRQREEGRNAAWVDSLQSRYRVSSFPTLVVTGPGGAGEARRVEGFVGREATLLQLGAGGGGVQWQWTSGAPPDSR
jgi:thiol:disulfide interchange protein